MTKKLSLIILTVLSTGLYWTLWPPSSGCTEFRKIVLTGSSTVAPLAVEIGKRFESQHPDVRVDVQTGGSSRGVNNARAGLADIGMASRALKALEDDLSSFTIALDGIGIIVGREERKTSARYALKDPSETALLLKKLLERLQ